MRLTAKLAVGTALATLITSGIYGAQFVLSAETEKGAAQVTEGTTEQAAKEEKKETKKESKKAKETKEAKEAKEAKKVAKKEAKKEEKKAIEGKEKKEGSKETSAETK